MSAPYDSAALSYADNEGFDDDGAGYANYDDAPSEQTYAPNPLIKPSYQLCGNAEDTRWLMGKLGTGRLSGFFLKGGKLVRVSRIDEEGYVEPPPVKEQDPCDDPNSLKNHNGPATVRLATAKTLQARLLHDYKIHKVITKGRGDSKESFDVEAVFPQQAAELVLELLEECPNLNTITGVTHTPLVRADGSILTASGYDPASQFLHLPTVAVPEVPERPSEFDLRRATNLLRGMVNEFEWDGTHDEANFFGILLTPLLRLLTPPPYMLAIFNAHQPGSGKSLLALLIRAIHGGVLRCSFPTDEAEVKKSTTSILACTTGSFVTFDNCRGKLDSATLDGLLTTSDTSDRGLGSTNNTDLVNDRVWSVTANNLTIGGDLARRSLWCSLNPGIPNPQARTGFKLDLYEWVPQHRGELLWALLVWITAWRAAGSSKPKLASSDSYGQWIRTVRGILSYAGVPGTFAHADSSAQVVSSDDDEWGDFLEVVHEVFGEEPWLARDVLSKVNQGGEVPFGGMSQSEQFIADHPIPLAALPAELGEKITRRQGSATRSLGWWLRNRQGRYAGSYMCMAHGPKGHDGQQWCIRKYEGNAA